MTPRVLHILNTAAHRGTGIAKIVRSIATRLGHRFAFSAWFVYENGPLVELLKEDGIDARFVPILPGLSNPAGPLKLWSACRKGGFTLIHHHSADARVRWILRQATDAAILFHLHGRAVETDRPVPQPISTRYADRVITVSKAVAEFTPPGSEVVYTGVPASSAEPRVPAEGKVVIGTACRFIPLKGIDRLLRAFARARQSYPNLFLELAGDGAGGEQLRSEADELGISDRVSFLGWQDDIRWRMLDWSIYVHPALEEGLGLSIVEAMAEGLPVIATRTGGVPEVVRDAETGWLVDVDDEQAMTERMVALADDAALRADMGRRARQWVQERFSLEGFTARIAEIYDEMLSVNGHRLE